MDAILERCAGLDVHQETVVECVLYGAIENKPKQIIQTFKKNCFLYEHEVTHGYGKHWCLLEADLEHT